MKNNWWLRYHRKNGWDESEMYNNYLTDYRWLRRHPALRQKFPRPVIGIICSTSELLLECIDILIQMMLPIIIYYIFWPGKFTLEPIPSLLPPDLEVPLAGCMLSPWVSRNLCNRWGHRKWHHELYFWWRMSWHICTKFWNHLAPSYCPLIVWGFPCCRLWHHARGIIIQTPFLTVKMETVCSRFYYLNSPAQMIYVLWPEQITMEPIPRNHRVQKCLLTQGALFL